MHIRISIFMLIAIFAFGTSRAQLVVTSTSFKNNGLIPAKYSCEGAEVSPPLDIANIPSTAKSLALIVDDPDAPIKGGFTHWVMWNMDVKGYLPEGFKNAMQGLNSAKKTGYKGMCPPTGTHHYHFKVYALDEMIELDHNNDKESLEKRMQGHILAEGELIGLYKKTR